MHKMSAVLLSAGFGTRLKPYTDVLPKCLMPVNGQPLLGYWIQALEDIGISDIHINTHYLHEQVEQYLQHYPAKNRINILYEPNLMGTAGTIRKLSKSIEHKNTMIIHADNWSLADLESFIAAHFSRPTQCDLSMMLFETEQPTQCGIVQLDAKSVVQNFYEKVANPPGNLANAAVYILNRSVIDWIANNKQASDFSNDVLPHYVGSIFAWKNNMVHRDIGTIENLRKAQHDNAPKVRFSKSDWHKSYNKKLMQYPLSQINGALL